MQLNEFNQTPIKRISKINKMLSEQFGFTVKPGSSKSQLMKLRESAEQMLISMRNSSKKFHLDPDYAKFLGIRDVTSTILEAEMYAQSPAYEAMCQHMEETVRDLMDAGYTADEAASECMNRYRRDSRYAYDDEFVLPIVLTAAKSYVDEYGKKDGEQLDEILGDQRAKPSDRVSRCVARECGIKMGKGVSAIDDIERQLDMFAKVSGKPRDVVVNFLNELDEDAMIEGVKMFGRKIAETNAFIAARRDAIKAGKKEFELDGKTYPVTGADAEEVKSIKEGVADKIRGHNYKRLAKRSMKKAADAIDRAADYDFSDLDNREEHEDEFMKQMAKRRQRAQKASKLLGRDVDLDEEKAKNPYAIGMAQAMKSTGDEPPLKKSTITKAHDIAKKIKKTTEGQHEAAINGKEVDLDSIEVMSRGGATDLDDFYSTLYVGGAKYVDGTPVHDDDLHQIEDMIDLGEYAYADDLYNVAAYMNEDYSDEDVEDVMSAIFRRLRMVHYDAIKGIPPSDVQDAVHDVARDYVEGGIVELGTSDVRALTQHALSELGVKESMEENYLSLEDMMIFEDVDVEQAEVVMAVRALSSDLQDQIERLGRMVNEDLPPIADQIKSEMGADTARQFYDRVSEIVNAQLESARQAKDGMDEAIGMLTGEDESLGLAGDDDMGDMDLGGMDAEEPEGDMDLGLGDLEEPAGAEEPLGRAEV